MSSGSGTSTTNSIGQQTSSSQSHIEIPPELKPLYTQSAQGMQNLQSMAPLWGKQDTVLKEGAVPTSNNVSYPWIVDQPASSAVTKYKDVNGNVFDQAESVGGGTFRVANKDGSYTEVSPFQDTTAGAATGHYDYANPINNFTYAPEDYITQQTSPNYLAENPMKVAGADPLQTWASQNVQSLLNTPQGDQIASQYGLLAPLLAGKMATGAGVEQDPAVLAASAAFEKLLAPGIENQMGLAGLGKSSSLANALGMSKTSYMLPLIQDYIKREQDTMNNQANMYASLMPQFTNLGAAETARLTATLNDAMQVGGTMRGINQEPLTAEYQDFLRRQALAEQALFVPFGATAGASIGPSATSTSQGTQQSTGSQNMSQGMFK